ncbi:putative alpha-1,6-mannanase (GH76 family) [Leeuwenhoekiella aestuarii]|uniref:Putative alpha-1,6-mannanase (GH76 family) n=1 Tax=Leeuwenhoekiella aestuarii TaxID=2249426 RepID=A0A4Q0NSU5_9FLAO|nr:glycoside hydrolase family 76 protein [Leeuwenhoekiella aestuarii]RXG13197.1 putative alpha-1,6-mannanase (GH76 family) [Leeuwenhoekiella aestuarii]RXG15067.1 putative alpha-1,6-mannanase (GH76 family) [Leeuwenhoekiella aestuarii]
MRFQFNITFVLLLTLLGGALISCSDNDPIPLRDPSLTAGEEVPIDWAATADSIQDASYNIYLGSEGTYVTDNQGNTTFQYWPNAHVLHVLVDAYVRTQDGSYLPKMKSLLLGIKSKNGDTYSNVFNDDMLWLGNSTMRAYNATGDEEYLEVAKFLWDDVLLSYSEVLGGGIAWKKDTPFSKNAVSNGPTIILGMRLYDATGDETYLNWAKDLYEWEKANLVDPTNGEVWDNIQLIDGNPVIQKDWVFTYNMGTWIGAGLRLYNETGEQGYLNDALQSARTTLTSPKLTTQGVLRDEGQGDGGLFKGILVRYFTEMILEDDISEDDYNDFLDFLIFNGETFYNNGLSRPGMLSSPDWRNAPPDRVDLKTQLSGIMLVEAMAKLEAEGLLTE